MTGFMEISCTEIFQLTAIWCLHHGHLVKSAAEILRRLCIWSSPFMSAVDLIRSPARWSSYGIRGLRTNKLGSRNRIMVWSLFAKQILQALEDNFCFKTILFCGAFISIVGKPLSIHRCFFLLFSSLHDSAIQFPYLRQLSVCTFALYSTHFPTYSVIKT